LSEAPSPRLARRELLCRWLRAAALAGFGLDGVQPARASQHGRVDPPLPAPALELTQHDGRRLTLPELLRGHASAVQLMFTSCRSTCPLQGAIFQRVQQELPSGSGLQLVSLSVDPERDDPTALTRWLRRFEARAGWVAAAPRLGDVERLRSFGGAGRSAADNHSTRVQIIDREARLIWRTDELPEPDSVARLLENAGSARARARPGSHRTRSRR
jgi:protein SCO1/2